MRIHNSDYPYLLATLNWDLILSKTKEVKFKGSDHVYNTQNHWVLDLVHRQEF
jgi:hypothetical protein